MKKFEYGFKGLISEVLLLYRKNICRNRFWRLRRLLLECSWGFCGPDKLYPKTILISKVSLVYLNSTFIQIFSPLKIPRGIVMAIEEMCQNLLTN